MNNSLNINGSDDPFNRYKMDKIQLQPIRNTTCLINLGNISKSLDRTPRYFHLLKKKFEYWG